MALDIQKFRNAAGQEGFTEEEIDQFLIDKGIKDKQSPILGFARGAIKGIGSTLFGGAKLGEEILTETVGRGVKAITGKPVEKVLKEKPEFLEPKGFAEKAGFTFEQIAEFAIPAGKIIQAGKAANIAAGGGKVGLLAEAGINALGFGAVGSAQEGEPDEATTIIAGMIPIASKVGKPIIKGLARKTSDFFFGPEGTSGILARYKDPQGVEKFLTTARRQPGGENVEDIVSVLNKAIKSVSDKSVKKFVSAEEKIIQTKVKSQPVLNEISDRIKDFLKVEKLTAQSIKSSALSDVEANTINKTLHIIKSNKNWTTKGILGLKRKVDTFFRGTEVSAKSDALITRITKVLNEAIGLADPTFREATKSFAKDKKFLEKLGINIVGKTAQVNVDQTANKLFQLAKDLDNPFKREASEALLRELGKRTGIDFIKILTALKTANNLSPQNSLGLRAGVIREIIRALQVGVSEVAGFAGKATQKIPKSPIQFPQGLKRSSLFELIQQISE